MPRVLVHRIRDDVDWVLFGLTIVISLMGIVNLYSTGHASDTPELYLTQIYFLVFGACVAFAVSMVDYRHYERLGYVLYGVGILLLVFVLIVGTEINNCRRWIFFTDVFRFQPSELMKVLLVVGLAKYLHHDPQTEGRRLTDIVGPSVMTVVAMILIFKEPDLGTALVCLLIYLSIMMITRLKARSLLVLAGITPIVSIIAWNYLLRPYQKQRVISYWNSFIDPEADRLGSGWHAYQSTVAIGSGRVTVSDRLSPSASVPFFFGMC